MNDAQIGVQLEFKGIEAKGQSFPNGLQGRFFETPQLEESPRTFQAANPFNSIRLGSRKKMTSEFHSF
jgi:hypothetical protein